MKKLHLDTKEDVRLAIRRRGIEIAKKMTDEDLFLSPAFQSYATRLADFILKSHKLYSLDIVYDKSPNGPIAYTDGKKIYWNTGNPLAAAPKLLERRFKVNLGILFHECAHKLFIDFTVSNKINQTLEAGKLYGKFDTYGLTELEDAKSEFLTAWDTCHQSITEMYLHLDNSLLDGHDEQAMCRCFPGFIADCIQTADEVQQEQMPTVETMLQQNYSELAIVSNLLLQYVKNGYYKFDERNTNTEPYISLLETLEPILDEARNEDDFAKRWDLLNTIMLYLWPVLKKSIKKDAQNQQNSGNLAGSITSGSGAFSDTQIAEAIQQAIQQATAGTYTAPAPKNGKGHGISPVQIKGGKIPLEGQQDIERIVQEAAQEEAINSVQNIMDKQELEALRNVELPVIHSGVTLTIKRHNQEDKIRYNKISREIAPYVRNLIKNMKELLRELNEECIQHHRTFGPIIEATNAYRRDGTFFAKKKLPEDLPNMAICILLDQSASMNGSKINAAKKTAILVEQFASALNIPLMVAGHCASSRRVTLRIFRDFVSAREDHDRYSLAGIFSENCNRDGVPIKLCCDRLLQRTEQVKLMIIISDGAPNDDGYKGKNAQEDISKIVSTYRKKGILIYGAAIDDDKSTIQKIYGKGFLSIQDLSSLPKTLVRMIRQQII